MQPKPRWPDLDLDFRPPAFQAALDSLPLRPEPPATDEPFWTRVAQAYDTEAAVVNLENGYWGAMAEPIHEIYRHWTARVNHGNTVLIRRHWPAALDRLRATVAQALGCERDEIVLARGATGMADQPVSSASLIQNRADRPAAASLVLTTHDSNERAIPATIARLKKLSVVLEAPVLLRIGDFGE